MDTLFVWLPALLRLAIASGCTCFVPGSNPAGSIPGISWFGPLDHKTGQATLYCLVTDEQGRPVNGACVQALDSKETAVSTRLGNCSFDIYPWDGKIRLMVSKYGFFSTEADIPVTPGRSRVCVIALRTTRVRLGKKLPGSGESPGDRDAGKMRIIPCGTIFVLD